MGRFNIDDFMGRNGIYFHTDVKKFSQTWGGFNGWAARICTLRYWG